MRCFGQGHPNPPGLLEIALLICIVGAIKFGFRVFSENKGGE
jgi:hypothetical protein